MEWLEYLNRGSFSQQLCIFFKLPFGFRSGVHCHCSKFKIWESRSILGANLLILRVEQRSCSQGCDPVTRSKVLLHMLRGDLFFYIVQKLHWPQVLEHEMDLGKFSCHEVSPKLINIIVRWVQIFSNTENALSSTSMKLGECLDCFWSEDQMVLL